MSSDASGQQDEGRSESSSVVTPDQVAQFLLSKNYYLTALELLVESVEHGNAHEVEELQFFFNDDDKFPAKEVSKYQNVNALEVQAVAREREERLQLVEYELRVAREDLQELQQRLARQQEEGGSAAGAAAAEPAAALSAEASGASSVVADLPPPQDIAMLAEPTLQQLQVLNSGVLAHLLKYGYKMAALTLEEEALDALPPSTGQAPPGASLWQWHCYSAYPGKQQDQEAELAATRAELARAEADKQLLRGQLAAAQQQVGALQDKLLEQHAVAAVASPTANGASSPLSAAGGRPLRKLALARRGSTGDVEAHAAMRAARGGENGEEADEKENSPMAGERSPLAEAGNQSPLSGRPRNSPWRQLKEKQLTGGMGPQGQELLTLVTEALPKILPNCTLKSRSELMPLLLTAAKAHCGAEQRQLLAGLVFQLVPNPDTKQCGVIVAGLLELAASFGSGWSTQVLLPMCSAAASSQSAERRALVASALESLLPLLEAGPSGQAVLGLLERLAKDRIPRVREGALSALTALLQHLPFLRHYYTQVEDITLQLVQDACEEVHTAALATLLPALLTWSHKGGVLTTSLLPRTLTTLSSLLSGPQVPAPPAAHLSAAALASRIATTFQDPQAEPPQLLSDPTHLQAYQLLSLYRLVLPHVQSDALAACPAWIPPSAATRDPHHPLAAPIPNLPRPESSSSLSTTGAPLPSSPSNPDFISLDRSPEGEEITPGEVPISEELPLPELVDATGQDMDALVAAWLEADEARQLQWAALHWALHQLLPLLVQAAVACPPSDILAELRGHFAAALHLTCITFGPSFTRAAAIPVFACAAAVAPAPPDIPSPAPPSPAPPITLLWDEVPPAIPRTAAATLPADTHHCQLAWERVLPHLLAVVLPAAGSGLMVTFLRRLMQPPESDQHTCWALQHRQDLQAALAFVAAFCGPRQELLDLFPQLVKCSASALRLCAVALAGVLLQVVGGEQAEDVLQPGLMHLLASADKEVQVATITAYGDIARMHGARPGITSHVRAVFDNLLQDGAHEIQLAVLRALSKAIAPEPGVRTVAGPDVLEYLMQKVQFLLLHMQTTLQSSRSHEQQRELASLLLGIVHAVNLHESKEARIQSYVTAAGDSLQRLRTLLDESQLESLGTISTRPVMGQVRPSPPPSPPPEKVVQAAGAAPHGDHRPALQHSMSMPQHAAAAAQQATHGVGAQHGYQPAASAASGHQPQAQQQQTQQQQQQQAEDAARKGNRLAGFKGLVAGFRAKHLQGGGQAANEQQGGHSRSNSFFDDE